MAFTITITGTFSSSATEAKFRDSIMPWAQINCPGATGTFTSPNGNRSYPAVNRKPSSPTTVTPVGTGPLQTALEQVNTLTQQLLTVQAQLTNARRSIGGFQAQDSDNVVTAAPTVSTTPTAPTPAPAQSQAKSLLSRIVTTLTTKAN